jgi:hypothetical protein
MIAPASSTWGYSGWDSDYYAGYFVGIMLGAVISYMVFIAWWLDHVLAGTGPWAVMTVHAIVAGGMGTLFASSNVEYSEPMVASWFLGLFGLAAASLSAMFASRVKGSFESGPQRDEDLPWGQGSR